MLYDRTRKLVFWGTGLICNGCLKNHPLIEPDFFIDSNPHDKLLGKRVLAPSEISEWKRLFIVITTSYSDEIEKYLILRGLKRGIDFVSYRRFFNIKGDCKTSIEKIEQFIFNNPAYKNSIFLFGYFFTNRQEEKIIHFFHEYIKKLYPKKIIIFSNLDTMSEKEASKNLGAPVFNIADLARWDGTESRYNYCNESIASFCYELSLFEEMFVKNLEERKTSFDKEKSVNITMGLYGYLRELVKIIIPSQILIWGEWFRISYILAEIAKQGNIPYGFFEWGWLPGTIQFEKGGIAGQSEYAVCPNIFHNYKPHDYSIKKIYEIKSYILNNQIDTGLFKKNLEDEKQLKKIDPMKKTVFLVGMSDVEMGMNPNNDYWKDFISQVVYSTEDSFSIIKEICKNNNLNLIYKPHPHSRKKEEDNKYRSDKDIIYITDMSIDKIINISDVVVSIVSTVDFKVLIYKKALVSLGNTVFKDKGCVYEIRSRNEVEKILLLALENGMTEEQNYNYDRFLKFLLDNYLWDDLSHPDYKYGLSFSKPFL